MASIFATTEEVQRKAGANASATSNVGAYIDDFMTQAESLINVLTGFNWSDAYSALSVDTKGILKMAASNWAAVDVIRFNMDGYTSRAEARLMINSLIHGFNICISQLVKKVKEDFIRNATV